MRPHLPDRTCHPGPFCSLSTSAANPTRTSTDTLQGTPQHSNSKADSLQHHLSGQSHKVETRPCCTRNHSLHTLKNIKSCLRIHLENDTALLCLVRSAISRIISIKLLKQSYLFLSQCMDAPHVCDHISKGRA